MGRPRADRDDLGNGDFRGENHRGLGGRVSLKPHDDLFFNRSVEVAHSKGGLKLALFPRGVELFVILESGLDAPASGGLLDNFGRA